MSAIYPDASWAFDFVDDSCTNGQKLKWFAVKDKFTRECLAIEVQPRYRSQDVLSNRQRLIVMRARPTILRCDDGPKLIALILAQ